MKKFKLWASSLSLCFLLTGCSALHSAVKEHESGNLDQAIQLYQAYLSYNEDPDAHNNLGNAWLQKQDFAQALSHYKQALALKADPVYLTNLEKAYAWTLKRSQNPDLVKEAHDFAQAPDKLAFVQTQAKVMLAQEPETAPATTPPITQTLAKTSEASLDRVEQAIKPAQPVATANTSTSAQNLDYSKLKPAAVKWAVVIGISDYDENTSGYKPLPYAAKDAQKVYQYLTKEGGFAQEHVKLLLDKDATAENIREAFGRFLRNNANNPDDIVFVYYSGHGDLLDRTDAYVVPYGAERKHLVSQGIALDEVNKHVSRLDSTKVAMFIDSCHSGSVIQGVNSKGILQNMTGITQNFLNLASKGRLVLTSSQADEESLEIQGTGGLFTHYLLKGLRGEADIIQRDKKITVDELYQYVRRNVIADSRNIANRSQTPQKNGDLEGVLVQIN